MSRKTKLAATSVAALAAAATVAVPATPAMAWTAGPVTANLSGTMTINAGVAATCTSSTLGGTIATNGALSITSASVGGCGVTVTPQALPWSGSLSGGVATLSGFRMSAIGCSYGGSLTGSYSGADNLPVTVTFTNQTVNKVSGLFCPSSATITATYVFS
ncbi:hypothetical protein [Spirillospora sp. NPDC047279]|uniref:hypothetical protein n=1 Tax=Spirillospora sp. NPDC047279 TaxID=3155478 RepID=UPI0033E6EA11